jgi:hypothetical protein
VEVVGYEADEARISHFYKWERFNEGKKGNGCELITKKEEYINTQHFLKIKCKCGNIFKTRFYTFLTANKRQCNECGKKIKNKNLKKDYQEVKRYIEVESQSGCKLISKDYQNYNTPLKILCPCGEIFYASLGNFKYGKRRCNICNNKIMWNYKMVKNYIEKESDSGCKLLSKEYINMNQKLHIQCRCGNDFYTSFSKFKDRNKRHCKKCTTKIKRNLWNFDYDYVKNFIEVESKSGCKLLSKEYINNSTPLKIQCSCGNIFEATFSYFKSDRSPRKCLNCTKKSVGENKINEYLSSQDIIFERQYTFPDLKSNKGIAIRYDFAIFDKNKNLKYLVEYDGIQHFEPVCFGGISKERALENFEQLKINDEIKNTYCKKNNIKLVRIPYWEFDNIENILNDILKPFDEVFLFHNKM